MNLDAVSRGISAFCYAPIPYAYMSFTQSNHSFINSQPLAASNWRYCDHNQLLLSYHLSLEHIQA